MTLRTTVRAIGALSVCAALLVSTLYVTYSTAQSTNETRAQTANDASPIYSVRIPRGYRDWHLISVKRLTGGKTDDPALIAAHMALKQLRAELGNDIATKAFREGTLPFPDGAIITALHWNEAS